MAINSYFEHSGKQIGTLTGEWLEEALLPIPPGLAGGSASVPIQRQSLCSIIQHDSMGLEHRTQMGGTDARCQPLALSLCLSSLYRHKYICTPSNIDSLCSLWQAQAVCFCGLMSPLYLSVITLELSYRKTKREPVVCASAVGWRSMSTATPLLFDPSFHLHSLPLSINFYLTWGNHTTCQCVRCVCMCIHSRFQPHLH